MTARISRHYVAQLLGSIGRRSSLLPVILVVAAICGPVALGEIVRWVIRPVPKGYDCYINDRFGYSVAYPHGVLFEQGEGTNGDGQAITSKSGDAKLLVYGSLNVLDHTTKDNYREFKANGDGPYDHPTPPTITYTAIRKDWMVASGYANGNVIYHKYMLDKYGDINLTFIYPIKKKAYYDPIAAKIAASFGRTRGLGYQFTGQ